MLLYGAVSVRHNDLFPLMQSDVDGMFTRAQNAWEVECNAKSMTKIAEVAVALAAVVQAQADAAIATAAVLAAMALGQPPYYQPPDAVLAAHTAAVAAVLVANGNHAASIGASAAALKEANDAALDRYLMYGDSIYPWMQNLRSRHNGGGAANDAEDRRMSTCREAVEHKFQEADALFPCMSLFTRLNIGQTPLEAMYFARMFLLNCVICVNGGNATVRSNPTRSTSN